ncbi:MULTISPECIES: LysR substrate-binding domain-containing protein [Burkholderiaceae]|uniref:Hydrogen peroxide-inducible activator n=1 Tax=Caballeronia sordidicola TaxID=196367 RepID=A0A242MDE1_CABSO|nr:MULTISPECIES: LysR substrate-binding domain-containing protein [Burkholderiaceae]AME24909.1 LysR family transcriptional regulator [Burkholderia sp. PAMC 26561]OTP69314.1 hydrogen peroxide-inducible activator [Caballeronia sordidicola]
MRFDLIDLRLFLYVLETGSITHGAAQANMSLPSASARLRGMEEALRMPLLERGRRGVETTPAGDTLAHHARLVLAQIERMQGELGEHSEARKTRIRLWANTAAVTEFLPRPLAEFLRDHPNVHIDMKERQSAETVKAVLNGSAEIGIVADAVEHGSLQAFPFATDKLVLIVARDHALSGQRKVALRDVVGEDFIGLSAGSALSEYLGEQALFAGQNFYFRARMRTFENICCMVEHGAGIAIVPVTAARRYRGTLGVRIVELTDRWAPRQLLIVVRDLDALQRPERALVDGLIQLQQVKSK